MAILTGKLAPTVGLQKCSTTSTLCWPWPERALATADLSGWAVAASGLFDVRSGSVAMLGGLGVCGASNGDPGGAGDHGSRRLPQETCFRHSSPVKTHALAWKRAVIGIAGFALALWLPFDRVSWPATSYRCGSPESYISREIYWGAAGDLSLSNDPLKKPMYKIGLYSLNQGGAVVPALSLNLSNSVEKARSYFLVETFDGWDKQYLKRLRKVLAYLAKSKDLGSDENAANPRALQLTIWEYLGESKADDLLKGKFGSRKSYLKYVAEISKEIAAIAADDIERAPFWLNASMATTQHYGWLTVRVRLQYLDGTSAKNQEVLVQTTGSVATGTTNEDGVASLQVRNPAPGRDQAMRVIWNGAIPAGTVLAASGYPREWRKKNRAWRSDYIVTTSPTPARLSLVIHHFANACASV